MQAKRNDGNSEPPTLQKLQKTCDRIRGFCGERRLFVLDNVSLMHLTTWAWDRYFSTSHLTPDESRASEILFPVLPQRGRDRKNPAAAWKRIAGKVEQVFGLHRRRSTKR